MTSIRVLLADDEPLVRQGLRMILDSEDGIEVVGEAADGAEALAAARREEPDVICMDVRMPGVDGIRATELALRLPHRPRVLVVTTFEHDQYVQEALAAGAAGFLLKRARAEEIVQAVRTVASSDSLLLPEHARALLRPRPRRARPDGPELTARESEVLALLAEGLSNAEIADRLQLGVETIRTHVAAILRKLGARDRTQAAVIAYRSGLVEP
ncbi:LuxR family transcriptional regulator [Brachybacterium phenoliresistens]|uniref:LuxR family transcriptional regulator n=1 Tax=Brachybacterium phenoliresistens TaxID=396014 RepID=Z9JQP6_9MICO|nr:response regulator transcription factor [Brachybacterium phenoliresistens]EWS80047.1 LuxR family transcriptional regulator [Brachybacterium phenoliresistens]